MQLRGLHHVTAICRDAERTIAFYRDVLGLAVVHDGPSDDDPESRHVWFGALDGRPGMLVSFMQYPELPTGVVGVGSTHHFAFVVESAEEQEAWRDYLRSQDDRVHRRVRPWRLPLDLHPRSRRAHRRDRDQRARLSRRRSVRVRTGGPPAVPCRCCSYWAAQPTPAIANESIAAASATSPFSRRGERAALTVGHRADGLRLRHGDRGEEPAAARAAPAMLAQQQVGDRHALGLPRAREHDVAHRGLPFGHLPLELSPGQANPVRLRKCAHMLRRGGRHCCVH